MKRALSRWLNTFDAFAMPGHEINNDNEDLSMVFIEATVRKSGFEGVVGGSWPAVFREQIVLRGDGNSTSAVANSRGQPEDAAFCPCLADDAYAQTQ